MFKVIKHDGNQVDYSGQAVKTQCGAAVKTAAKAYNLMARMRAQQAPGSCNWFTIEPAKRGA